MRKVVISTCYGGFGLSPMAEEKLKERGSAYIHPRSIPRNDLNLISVIETYGSEACSGRFAQLKIVEIPDDVIWEIEEYDGTEWVAEVHRTWS